MNELIKISKNEDGVQTVNGRELHEFLESKQEFVNWIKSRIQKYGFIESIDFLTELSKSSGGRPSKEYYISIDMAKELSMVENNEKGREARRYFIACENAVRKAREQGITQEYKTDLVVGTMMEKINYLTDTVTKLTDAVSNLSMSELDMFASEDGGFYRKEVRKLVQKRSREKHEKITTTWYSLYKAFQNKTGLNPFTMSDSVGITKMDWIATKGRLKSLYEEAVKLCTDRSWNEESNTVDFDLGKI